MIDAKVNLSTLDRVLIALRRPDLRPAWKEARKPLRADIGQHRKDQRGPDGAWAPRSSATRVRAAGKRRGRPRQILGKLPTALTAKYDRRRVAMISRVAWSEVQRSGGTVGHGAKIPGRDWMWASDRVLGVIAGLVTNVLDKIWKRG